MKTNLTLTTNHVLILVGVGFAGFTLYKGYRAGKKLVSETINPASDQNFVYQGAVRVVGEESIASVGDYIFGMIDLMNPFNESDQYAKKVYGIDSDEAVINEQ